MRQSPGSNPARTRADPEEKTGQALILNDLASILCQI